jgi:type I restriction enzyme R subunit
MQEYDKFEKGAANSSKSTAILKKQLEDPSSNIIITTIQKLDRFISKNKGHKIFKGHVVLIFDECHRSQFGDMHSRITKSFNKYHLFGFTGTPIFTKNSSNYGKVNLKTTDQAFGEKLHTYTIVNAIEDGNVLPFRNEYISTMRKEENIEDKKIKDIDRKEALESPERIENIAKYIIDNFDTKTKRNKFYDLKGKSANGFNSIFTVSSIEMAMKYYAEFKKQLKNAPENKKLKIATIYSFSANEEEIDGMIDENSEDTRGLDKSSRDFLDNSIKDYNKMFATSWDTSSEGFQGYYKDVSQKVKDRELDLLIVVNMFLTGFDATTLNTLWVDKNLKMHGLLQAYSRTNRILNSVKCFGNIVCFRNLEEATNESISLFGDKDACGVVLIKKYEEYYNGYEKDGKKIDGYSTLVEKFMDKFGKTINAPELIQGEGAQREFVTLYNAILKIKNILSVFDDFEGNQILTDRDIQNAQSEYLRIANEFRKNRNTEKENINDDLIFEMELIKQIDINIDYVLNLVKKFHQDNTQDKEILANINRAIGSSMQLRNKKELIEEFISTLDSNSQIDDEWIAFVSRKKIEQLERIIEDEDLKSEEAKDFMDDAFRDGYMYTSGSSFSRVLPSISRFSEGGDRTKKRENVVDKFTEFFNKFYDISNEL